MNIFGDQYEGDERNVESPKPFIVRNEDPSIYTDPISSTFSTFIIEFVDPFSVAVNSS